MPGDDEADATNLTSIHIMAWGPLDKATCDGDLPWGYSFPHQLEDVKDRDSDWTDVGSDTEVPWH